MDEQTVDALIFELENRVSVLEGKMDDLFMRPRMPYTQNAVEGDFLTLDADLTPIWSTPAP